MKYSLTILLCFLFAGASYGQQKKEFTLNGKLSTSYYDGLTIYLNEIDYSNTNKISVKDSTVIAGDKFTFKGNLDKTIAVRYITLADNDEVSALIILEPGTINLEISDIPVMTGTLKNDELSTFTQKQLNGRKELERILKEAQDKHGEGMLSEELSTKLETDFANQQKSMQNDVYGFVGQNILNEIGEFFFTIYAPSLGVTQLEELYASSTPQFQKGAIPYSLMKQYVWNLGDLREGKKFKGIEMKNLDGKIEDISVHFKKGNVVLVDFWASWCAPCIKSMPIIVKLYDRYKDAGFEIVGISLDENESSWKAAIKRLGMTWPQYIDDVGGWKGAAALEYNIDRIPQTYLLDRQGNIAGHDLSGVELIEKIEELLNEELNEEV